MFLPLSRLRFGTIMLFYGHWVKGQTLKNKTLKFVVIIYARFVRGWIRFFFFFWGTYSSGVVGRAIAKDRKIPLNIKQYFFAKRYRNKWLFKSSFVIYFCFFLSSYGLTSSFCLGSEIFVVCFDVFFPVYFTNRLHIPDWTMAKRRYLYMLCYPCLRDILV